MKSVHFEETPEYEPLTPPLSPLSPKSLAYRNEETSSPPSPTKLRRLQPSSKQRKVKPSKNNLDLHPLPLHSYSLLNLNINSPSSPSPLSISLDVFNTIDTSIDFDVSLYSTFSSSSSEHSSENSSEHNSERENIEQYQPSRKDSILSLFPLPPGRFSASNEQRETRYELARRQSFEAKERLNQAGNAGTLLEVELAEIKNRIGEFKRVQRMK